MKARYGYAIVLASLGAVYILLNFVLLGRIDGLALAYAVRPALWFGIFAVSSLVLLRTRSWPPLDARNMRIGLALAGAHLVLWFAAGAIATYGRSPYDFSALGLLRNSAIALSTLLGMEFARGVFVGAIKDKRFATILVSIAALFAVVRIPASAISGVQTTESVVAFAGSRALPLFAEELLATLLVFLGGVPAGLAYKGLLEGARWFLPILPDLPWPLAALVGVVAPVAGVLVLATLNKKRLPGHEEETNRQQSRKKESLAWWGGFGVVSVLVLWFSLGLFGPRPLLVASRSMSPEIDLGDVVIVNEVEPDTIAVGDVIAFESEMGTTIHRVTETSGEGSGCIFTTKGDANNRPDRDPVTASRIYGKVVLVVPKIGWLGIWVKQGVAALT